MQELDRRVMIGGAAALVAVVASYVVLGWLPGIRATAALRTTINQLEAQARDDQSTVAAIRTTKNELTALRGGSEQVNRSLPNDADIGRLLEQLSADLVSVGVKDPDIQAKPVVPRSDVVNVPLSLKFRGPLNDCLDFLTKLESGGRIIRVSRLDLHNDPKQAGTVQAAFELLTFYRKADEVTP